MTNKIRIRTLQPIGSGRLHTDPTCHGARQESLRNWASERRGVRDGGPIERDARASTPRR